MGRISFDSTRQLIALSLEVSSINADSVQAFSVTLDTGASITTIPSQVVIDLGYDLSNPKQEVDILTSSGIFTAKIITVRKLTAIGETVENIDVLCHDLPEDSIVEGLLGLNFLQYFDINISFSTGTIEIYPK
jgi:aspartyl protease family protein